MTRVTFIAIHTELSNKYNYLYWLGKINDLTYNSYKVLVVLIFLFNAASSFSINY